MRLNLNPKHSEALYIQIYKQLKDLIMAHKLEAHAKLPSKRQMAERNGVSQNTVVNAYNQLLYEGFIYAVERSGYYVNSVDYQVEIERIPIDPIEDQLSYQYDLTRSISDNQLFPYKVFSNIYARRLQEEDPRLLQATPHVGLYELRMALAHYLRHGRGVQAQAEQIVVASSSHELLSHLLPFLGPEVAIENPGYHAFNELFKQYKKKIHLIPIDERGLSLTNLEEKKVQTVLVSPSHQFPSGITMPIDRRQQLLKWASQDPHHYIIEDDYDSEFKYEGIPVPSLKALDQQDTVIYMGSFTRNISPALRVSFMVLPMPLMEVYQRQYGKQSSSVNTLTQWALHDFIMQGEFEKHLNASRRFYKKKRDTLIQLIKKYDPAASIQGQAAGLHILIKPSKPFDTEDLRSKVDKESIKLSFLSDYTQDPTMEDSQTLYFSFSSVPEGELEDVVRRIYQFI